MQIADVTNGWWGSGMTHTQKGRMLERVRENLSRRSPTLYVGVPVGRHVALHPNKAQEIKIDEPKLW